MKLLVLPGDDIGPEIVPVAVEVLEAVNRKFGLGVELTYAKVGMEAYAESGSTMPDALVAQAKAHDGVILGPLGTYAYPPKEEGGINPSGGFRKALDLYANLRPVTCLPVPASSCRRRTWHLPSGKLHGRDAKESPAAPLRWHSAGARRSPSSIRQMC